MKLLPRHHPATQVIVIYVASILLWANLRDAGWQEALNQIPPKGLDPLATWMFFRGWPAPPFDSCPKRGITFLADPLSVYSVLFFDAFVFVVAVFMAWFLSEWWFCPSNNETLGFDAAVYTQPRDEA